MRLVIALGGNALLRRGEPLTMENQRRNMRHAAAALARACEGAEVVIVHGNGPQVGLLALEANAYPAAGDVPLDVLTAESQGMVGYVIAQELANAARGRAVVTILTQTIVDPTDPAFACPTKPVGPVYPRDEARRLEIATGWSFAPEGDGSRRVVASPTPLDVVELGSIKRLTAAGAIVVCAGGGGIPVSRGSDGVLSGVEAVVDKDLTAALLAERLGADRLIILTDVEAVFADWGRPEARPLGDMRAQDLKSLTFAQGSMGPKVAAAAGFVERTGNPAVIGALADLDAVIAGRSGTRVGP